MRTYETNGMEERIWKVKTGLIAEADTPLLMGCSRAISLKRATSQRTPNTAQN